MNINSKKDRLLICLILFVCIPSIMKAQFVTSGEEDIVVTEEAVIFIASDWVNESPNLEVKGSVVLEGDFEQDAGQVLAINNFELVGEEIQQVRLLDELMVNKLVLNNAFGARIEGHANVEIRDRLQFAQGILYTNAHSLVVFGEQGESIYARNKSYLEGPCRKEGSGDFYFPIGRDGVLKPLYIAPDDEGVFEANYHSANQHWEISAISGAIEVSVALPVINFENAKKADQLLIKVYDGWDWTPVKTEVALNSNERLMLETNKVLADRTLLRIGGVDVKNDRVEEVIIYPNPVKQDEKLSLQWKSNVGTDLLVQIFDLQGRLVWQEEYTQDRLTDGFLQLDWDRNAFPIGMYYLSMNGKEGIPFMVE